MRRRNIFFVRYLNVVVVTTVVVVRGDGVGMRLLYSNMIDDSQEIRASHMKQTERERKEKIIKNLYKCIIKVVIECVCVIVCWLFIEIS